MKGNCGIFVTIIGVYIIGVCMSEENAVNEDTYNKVSVEFSDDPCDDRDLIMPDYKKKGRRVSEVKCLEYIWRLKYFQGRKVMRKTCERQIEDESIIGGSSATPGEYPHMVAIGWKAKVGTWIFKCGGSLISEKFVLTAAHCSRVKKTDPTVADIEPKIVRLNSESILDTYDGYLAPDIAILRFIKHHRYNPLRQYFDIALVELAEEAPFLWQVHPSCLWSKFENPEKGVLTGWGVIDIGTAKTSPILQKAEIKIENSAVCDQKLKFRRNRKWQGIMRHQICAGDNAGRIDTCQGDSGGPLQSKITLLPTAYMIYPWNVYQIVGVTSFGFGCARKDTPSIYTRVASFVGWIEKIVWPINITTTNAVNEDRFLFAT